MESHQQLRNKDEVSLLLFLETRAVDRGGLVHTASMNGADMELAKRWHKEGFIRFGRIVMRDVTEHGTHWVELTDEAWREAGRLRMERGKRAWLKRQFQTTEEKRALNVTEE